MHAHHTPRTTHAHAHAYTLQDWEVQAVEQKALGDESFKTGDYETAVKHYTSAISLDDSNHVFYSNRCACLLKLNEKSRALRDGEKCVSLKPDWAKGYGRLAAAQYSLRRYDKAAETYRDGLRVDPGSKALKEGLADAKAKAEEAQVAKKQEEEETKKKEEDKAKAEEDLLGDFFGEIETTVETSNSKANKKDTLPQAKYAEQDLGTSESQISRLLQTNYKWKNLNPYHVMQVRRGDAAEREPLALKTKTYLLFGSWASMRTRRTSRVGTASSARLSTLTRT